MWHLEQPTGTNAPAYYEMEICHGIVHLDPTAHAPLLWFETLRDELRVWMFIHACMHAHAVAQVSICRLIAIHFSKW